MPTYYEMLQLPPSASSNEIDEACERIYLTYKSLVTHHDPATAAQASQAIQQVEDIRTTLTDPSKRSIYDKAIGVGGVTGGLLDLTAIGNPGITPVMTPPRPVTPVMPVAAIGTAQQPGLWVCPKKGCGADNPAHTKYCLKCGAQLVQDCPNCGKTASLIATQRCGECGFSYEAATQRQNLRKREGGLGAEIEQLKRNKNAIILQKENAKKGFGWLVFLTILCAFIGICCLIGGMGASDGNGGGTAAFGLFLLLGAAGLAWGAVQANPSRRFDPQIQSVEEHIHAIEGEIGRTQAAYKQLADER